MQSMTSILNIVILQIIDWDTKIKSIHNIQINQALFHTCFNNISNLFILHAKYNSSILLYKSFMVFPNVMETAVTP